jgi:hypothetical protein
MRAGEAVLGLVLEGLVHQGEHEAIVLVDSGSDVNLALFQYLKDVVTSRSDPGVKALGQCQQVWTDHTDSQRP